MKNSHLSTVSSVIILTFIVPQIAFATWWNPLSWSVWDNFRATPKVQLLHNFEGSYYFNGEYHSFLNGVPTSQPTSNPVTPSTHAKTKAVETPAPKKVSPVVVPVQTVAPIQPATASADSQLLMIEKCKAKRDESKGPFWIALLQAVTLKEQKYQQTVMDVLTTSYPPGTVSGSALGEAIRITPAQHEKNLEEAKALMEAELAKEYSACLNGN